MPLPASGVESSCTDHHNTLGSGDTSDPEPATCGNTNIHHHHKFTIAGMSHRALGLANIMMIQYELKLDDNSNKSLNTIKTSAALHVFCGDIYDFVEATHAGHLEHACGEQVGVRECCGVHHHLNKLTRNVGGGPAEENWNSKGIKRMNTRKN